MPDWSQSLLYTASPIAIWLEDISELMIRFDQMRHLGVKDLKLYLKEKPDQLFELAALIKVVDVNLAALKMYGAKNKRELIDNLFKIYGSLDAEILKTSLQCLWERKSIEALEVIHKSLDNRDINATFWLSLPEDSSEYSQVPIYLLDNTEKRQKEAMLAANAEILNMLGENTSEAAFVVAADYSELLYANSAIEALYGVTVEEAFKDPSCWTKYLNPDDLKKLRPQLEQMQEPSFKTPNIQEFRVNHPLRGEVWVGSNVSPIEHKPGFIVGISRDITIRKHTELELFESKERLQLALSAAKAGIFDWKTEEGEVIWDERMHEIFELKLDSTLDRNFYFSQVLHPEDAQRVQLEFATGMSPESKETLYKSQFKIRLLSGVEKYVATQSIHFRDKTGKVTRVVGTCMDISDLKWAEEEQKKAREVAEAANRAKSVFLATMSHELRTPLNGILGLSEVLLMEDLNPEVYQTISLILNAGKSLLSLVTDILDFSRIEAGKTMTIENEFSLHEMAESLKALFGVTAEEREIHYSVMVDKNVPNIVVGDEFNLKKIISNLINNALKFTPKGSVQVQFRCLASVESETMIEISVQDTGIGIAEENFGMIFERFNRVDQSLSRKFGGAGLGLSIVRDLTSILGGTCGVESRQGQGSRFWVKLPFKQVNTHKKEALLKTPKAAPLSEVRIKVLVAEDDVVNQNVIRQMLARLGCDSVLVGDGKAALKAYSNNSFDLLLLDLVMPKIDGLEVARQIRLIEQQTMEEHPQHICAITAQAMEGDREKCFEVGMNDYIAKPIEFDHLKKVVGKFQ